MKKKIRKDNWWNRVFHNLIEQKERYSKCKFIVAIYPELEKALETSNSLEELLEAHKLAWRAGFKNTNLGPCMYGMFRTPGSILNMTSSEVYLGGIYGLFTKPIPFWEDNKEALYGDNGYGIPKEARIYEIIMSQYRKVLQSNFSAIYREASKYVEEYEKINKPKNPFEIIQSVFWRTFLLINKIKKMKAKKSEIKRIKDLMSLIGDAVATNSISEAEDYLVERYSNELDDEFIQHTFNILDGIHNKNNLK